MKRKLIVIGNWKMHKTTSEGVEFVKSFLQFTAQGRRGEVCLAVPSTLLSILHEMTRNSYIEIGAQNISEHTHGAFTGEISASMVKDVGASFTLIGHSERRHSYHETDEICHQKLKRALENGLHPVLCIGETSLERSESHTKKVLERQIASAIEGLKKEDLDTLVLAYEPVWAIGTGAAATPKIAQEAHEMCRAFIKKAFGNDYAEKLPILYGGSINPDTIAGLIKEPDIDGVLVGGASLHPETFAHVLNISREWKS